MQLFIRFIIGVSFWIGSILSRNPCTFSMPGQRPAIEYFVQKRRHRTDVGVGISERRFDAPVTQMPLNDREWRSISRQPGGNRVAQVMDAEVFATDPFPCRVECTVDSENGFAAPVS